VAAVLQKASLQDRMSSRSRLAEQETARRLGVHGAAATAVMLGGAAVDMALGLLPLQLVMDHPG
jgi:hypothetical protein